MLAVVVAIGTIAAAPKPKEKKIKIANDAVYYGFAVKKTPMGEGTITMLNCGKISGTFNGNEITNGKITFDNLKYVITGNFTMQIESESSPIEDTGKPIIDLVKSFKPTKTLHLTINRGKVGRTSIVGKADFVYCASDYKLVYHTRVYPKVDETLMENIKSFVGSTSWRRTSDGRARRTIVNDKVKRTILQRPTNVEYKFLNGATATFNISDGIISIERSNGDFITLTDKGQMVSNYKVSAGNGIIEKGRVSYTFENGYKYYGTLKGGDIEDYTKITTFNQLLSFKNLTWAWADFKKYADDGILTLTNGTVEKITDGYTNAEIAKIEAERKAREEAERLAREEAERKAREEAERLAKEESERVAKEEAARKAEEARQKKLLNQKVARLKQRYPAKFVNALAEGRFMEDMPYKLIEEFYGKNALVIDYSKCGSLGGIRMLVYDLTDPNSGYTWNLFFMSSRSGTFLSDWEVERDW